MNKIKIIGAGLAGCEAAWQIANRGFAVERYEMRPALLTPAHKTEMLAEIVCSNSLGSENKNERISAAGILKEELEIFNSLILSCAYASRVPAGGALAVDREKFSSLVTEKIILHKNIKLIREEVKTLLTSNFSFLTIVASEPLTIICLRGNYDNRFFN
ncbi:MAG: FAD-dependent oxidoreductase [Synergistaceae bacterium]|nr:FAD-dependent oxidoreductase [Synergistaceae bacterium]